MRIHEYSIVPHYHYVLHINRWRTANHTTTRPPIGDHGRPRGRLIERPIVLDILRLTLVSSSLSTVSLDEDDSTLYLLTPPHQRLLTSNISPEGSQPPLVSLHYLLGNRSTNRPARRIQGLRHVQHIPMAIYFIPEYIIHTPIFWIG